MFDTDTDTAHHKLCFKCSNRNPLDFEEGRPCPHKQFLDHEDLITQALWSYKVALELGCTCTKRNDTIARANRENSYQSAHSIHPLFHTATFL